MFIFLISFLILSAATLSYQYSCYLQYIKESPLAHAAYNEAFAADPEAAN